MAEIVDINGVKYVRKEKERPRSRSGSRMLTTMMAMATMMGGVHGMTSGRDTSPPAVDVPEEYALIQLKKSNLSKAQREWVVRNFEANYKKLN